MKKLATLGAVALLALSVTACNKADPKAEYVKFQEWTQSLEKTRQAAQVEFTQQLQTALTNKDAEAAKAAVKTFVGKLEQSTKDLDKLNFKSSEIKDLTDKTKKVLELSSESLVEQVNVAVAQTPEAKAEAEKKLQEKSQKLTQDIKEVQNVETELKTKLGLK